MNLKRLVAIILTVALSVLLLAGCGTTGNKQEGTGTAAATTAAGTTAAGTTGNTTTGAKIKVALVANQKFGDNGPMDDMLKGAKKAEQDFGIELKTLESSSASYEDDVRAMSKAGYNLVITTFPYMSDATKLVSKEFPNTNYSAIFQFINMGTDKFPNIWDTEFHGEGAFYLSGTMAGKITKTNKIGLVVGGEEPTPNAEGNAFMRGVKSVNPNATVEFAYVGSYEDPAKAKEISNAMIAKGVDIIQTDSGASNAGVVEAAKEANILCSGEITDFYDTYKGFYGIVGIGFGDTVYQSIKMAVEGKFVGGEHGIRDLTNGGYFMDWASFERFAAENKDFGPALSKAITDAKDTEKKILDKSLAIQYDDKVPNWDRIKAEK